MATGPIARAGHSDVFIAYARSNVTLATAVDRLLRGAGLRVWFDDRSVPPNTPWLAGVARGILEARHVVLLLTETTPRGWQRAELDFIARAVARRPEIEVVPVVREGYVAGELAGELEPLDPIVLPRDKGSLEEHLKALVDRLAADPGPPLMPPPPQGNPYPGLRPYGLADGRYFFGREREVVEACSRLGPQPTGFVRWLRVEGPPGVGKASFARAGVAPAVVRGAVAGVRGAWRVVALRPGQRPLQALAGAACAAFPEVDLTLARGLMDHSTGLVDLIREGASPDEGLLLVLDHLEDLLEASPADQAAFDGQLAEALEDFDQRLLLVTTARSDLIEAVFARLPRCRAAAVTHASLLALGGLSRAGVRQVVEGPTRMAGRTLPPVLAARLEADGEGHARAPALLCWVLRALCTQRPTPERYAALGGVSEGLARAVEAIYESLGDDDRSRARSLLVALVGAGRGAADRAVTIDLEEARRAAGDGPRADALLQRLAASEPGGGVAPALVQVGVEGGEGVRLAHGALVTAWPRLAAWVAEDRAVLERRVDVEQQAAAWRAAGEAAEALPGGPVLALLAGADLSEAQRRRLRASLRTPDRHFVEQAEAAEAALAAAEAAAAAAARAEAARAEVAEQGARAAHVLRLRLLVALGFAAAAATAWFAVEAFTRAREMSERVAWASEQRESAVAALREAEDQHLAAEEQRKAAERERALTERERRAADAQGARAEQSADVVLQFAVEAAVEADEFFRRIPSNDGKYARRMYAEAVRQRLEQRLTEEPNNRRLRYLLARQHGLIGDLEVDGAKYRAALPSYVRSAQAFDALVKLDPDPRHLEAQAEAHTRLGRLLSNARKGPEEPAEAVAHHTRAVAIWETLEAGAEGDRARLIREKLADTRADLGLAQLQIEGQAAAARQVLTASVEVTRSLVAEAPSDVELIHALARRLGLLADAEAALGDHAAAVAHFDEALRLLNPFTDIAEHRSLLRTRAQIKRRRKFAATLRDR